MFISKKTMCVSTCSRCKVGHPTKMKPTATFCTPSGGDISILLTKSFVFKRWSQGAGFVTIYIYTLNDLRLLSRFFNNLNPNPAQKNLGINGPRSSKSCTKSKNHRRGIRFANRSSSGPILLLSHWALGTWDPHSIWLLVGCLEHHNLSWTTAPRTAEQGGLEEWIFFCGFLLICLYLSTSTCIWVEEMRDVRFITF